ncbi:MAG: hypothetical protein DCC58_12175 [Chloroflexi bacterium]|nr:MAG: hypothetical protein DCC58_12175 [Chloroflexota bacterium]
MVATAQELVAAHGFVTVTMEQIARQAGVSVATVYIYFPGKSAIVAALADEIVAAADLSVEQVESEPDPIRQLEIGAGILRRLNERAWLVADILRSAHGRDAGLNAIWQRWQDRHLDAMRRGIGALYAQGALRPDLPLDDAVDIFYALAGTDVYRALVRERGWVPDQYERWLFQHACRELFAGSHRMPAESPTE